MVEITPLGADEQDQNQDLNQDPNHDLDQELTVLPPLPFSPEPLVVKKALVAPDGELDPADEGRRRRRRSSAS
jgi:hypothetical protein